MHEKNKVTKQLETLIPYLAVVIIPDIIDEAF